MHALTQDKPLFTLVLREPAWLRRLVTRRNPVGLAHGHFSGRLDVEGDLYSALALKRHFESIRLSWRHKLALLRDAWRLPAYLATVHRVLRPGGLFLNHGITHDEQGWNKTVAAEFINRDVFPDGELDCIINIQLGMERAGFEIHDVEGLRRHYALTLRHWVHRLEARRHAALQEVDEPTCRVWRLYMAACALEFEAGGTGIYQVLASRRDQGRWPVPLTRRDLYTTPSQGPPGVARATLVDPTPDCG